MLLLTGFSGCLFNNDSALDFSIIVSRDGSADFTSITEAISQAQTNDIIFVRNGIYKEHVTVNKTLQLIGEKPQYTIIDGSGSDSVLRITADNVSVSGFTIKNSGSKSTYYEMDAGIDINASFVKISQCTCLNNTVGIQMKECTENTVDHNILTNNSYGLFLYFSFSNKLSNNTINSNSDYGCYLYSGSKKNTILDNQFYTNRYGLRIKSEQNHVKKNLFQENNQGIWICCGAKNNIIFLNTFVNNSGVHADDNFNANQWYHPNLGGNYWSDYTGDDSDGDGFGEKTYIVDQSSSHRQIAEDEKPLMNPIKSIISH